MLLTMVQHAPLVPAYAPLPAMMTGAPPAPTPGPSTPAASTSASASASPEAAPMKRKPGRKPLQDEPATKRTAQNRASQRAFRERKQAHVASLEAKIAQYESGGNPAAVQLQALQSVMSSMQEENKRLQQALETRDKQLREKEETISSLRLEIKASSEAALKLAETKIQSPSDMLVSDPIAKLTMTKDIEDCGFCAGDGRCACRGDGIIDFDGRQGLVPQQPMPIAVRARTRKAPLWTTVKTESREPSGSSTASLPRRGPRKAAPLWPLASAPTCSGDPSNCNACSADPVLAKFCEAVAERDEDKAAQAQPDPQASTSLPDAFTQIRSHPHFPRFSHNLELLADVVSGRTHSTQRPQLSPVSSIRSSAPPLSDRQLPSLSELKDDRPGKRRRLYVAQDALRDTLAYLDKSALNPQRPCPCPWIGPEHM